MTSLPNRGGARNSPIWADSFDGGLNTVFRVRLLPKISDKIGFLTF